MITQKHLDDEIKLAKKIFIYYTEKVANYVTIASDRYTRWYVDSLQLYFLLGVLKDIRIEDDLLYMGAEEIEVSFVLNVFDKVREYYLLDVDTNYEFGEATVSPIPTYRDPYNSQWKEFTITIDEDRVATLALGVDIDTISDPESVIVYVNNNNTPIPNTDDAENGYHIIGNTLYWHNYYDLLIGDIVYIKYKQIVG